MRESSAEVQRRLSYELPLALVTEIALAQATDRFKRRLAMSNPPSLPMLRIDGKTAGRVVDGELDRGVRNITLLSRPNQVSFIRGMFYGRAWHRFKIRRLFICHGWIRGISAVNYGSTPRGFTEIRLEVLAGDHLRETGGVI